MQPKRQIQEVQVSNNIINNEFFPSSQHPVQQTTFQENIPRVHRARHDSKPMLVVRQSKVVSVSLM